MCSPKTMLKIGVAIAVPLGLGFVAFPQFRTVIIGLAPFAILALCPLAMVFGVSMMGKDKNGQQVCSSCGLKHEKQEHK